MLASRARIGALVGTLVALFVLGLGVYAMTQGVRQQRWIYIVEGLVPAVFAAWALVVLGRFWVASRRARPAIREAGIADIPAMHRVRLSVRENALSSPHRVTEADYVPALTSDGRGWVAERNGAVVAFAVAFRDGRVWALFVDPEHEGHGHGSALHAVMLEWLLREAHGPLRLTTSPATRAEAFYRAKGWVDRGVDGSGDRAFEWPR